MTTNNTDAGVVELRKCVKCREFRPAHRFRARICHECTRARKRAYYLANRARKLEYFRKHDKEVRAVKEAKQDPKKAKARGAVRNAVRGGGFRRLPCESCGSPKVEFHHTHGYDVSNWFVGEWLCRKHHVDAHIRINELRELKTNKEGRDG